MKKLLMAMALMPLMAVAAEVLTVGDESFSSSEKSKRFQHCNAYATYNEATGFVLTFSGSSVVQGGISARVDLKMSLAKGVVLDIVKDEYGRNNGISSWHNLSISGLGTINVVNGNDGNGCIFGGESIKIIGVSVNISQEKGKGATIGTEMSGPVEIEAALVTVVGYGTLISGGNITMTGSMVNLIQGASDKDWSDAVIDAYWGSPRISIVGSVVTMIASDEDSVGFNCRGEMLVGDSCVVVVTKNQCFYAWKKVSFLDSRVLAISEDSWGVGTEDYDCYVGTYTPQRYSTDGETSISFGDGKYVFASGKGKNTVLSGKVEIDGGDVELCSPTAIGIECYDFNMKDGSLQMVNDVSFKNCYEEILAKAAVEAVVATSGVFSDWTGLHTTMLASMVGELAATLVENPSGRAEMAISCDNFVQTGGIVRQGDAIIGCRLTRLGSYAWGVYNESISATAIPAFVGGVYDGTFETFGYEDDGSWSGVWHDHYDICPTNRIGQVLTHVDYSPYWVYRGTPSSTDLSPCAPLGWSRPLVLSKRANDLVGTTQFTCEDDIYVSFAVLNAGADLATPFIVSIYIDGMFFGYKECAALQNNYYMGWPGLPIGKGGVGNHRIVMSVDDLDEVRETNENNNFYIVDFSVVDTHGQGVGGKSTLVDETKAHVDVGHGEVTPYAAAAAVYDGYLRDANGIVKGTVQVKVAKMKNGEAKVTATVQLADGSKKLSFKNGVADAVGNVTGMSAGGHALDISLGVNGMGGSMDGNSVDGARNLFSSKSKEEKATADAIANTCIGTYNVVGEDGVLTVTVAKKGKAKVSGTWKGAKVSVSSQLLIGESVCVVPVVFAKKGVSLAFNLNIFGANDVTVTGLSVNAVGKPGTLAGGAAFRMNGAALAQALPGLLAAYLPDCQVAQNGTKWVVAGGAKAGKLALVKGTSDIDPAKSKFTDNMSGLKLTYKAKDGSFKGSFKAYNLENGKLKSYTVNVTGVMVGSVGYGTATVKKLAVSFPITVE